MQSILLLHGALGAASQFEDLKMELTQKFKVYSFSFEGHGGQKIDRPYTMDNFAENLKDFCKDNKLEKPIVFGYSMGGYVALYLSREKQYFEKIITLGTKFNWSAESAGKEAKMLNPEIIEEKVPKYANYLKVLHGENQWENVLKTTSEMMLAMGAGDRLENEDFAKINTPVMIGWGSEDTMVSKEESEYVASLIPNANFKVLEGVKHPIQMINTTIIVDYVLENHG